MVIIKLLANFPLLLFNFLVTQISVGNLVAEGDNDKSLKVFGVFSLECLLQVRCVGIYNLIEPFISVWLKHLLSHSTLILICINLFIQITRGAVDVFKYAFGLFNDTWSLLGIIIFIVVSLFGGYFASFDGVLLGGV